MKALILVGGFGTRLRPLTLSKPKPLVEFGNKVALLYQIEALVEFGVTEIVLAIAYPPNVMEDFILDVQKKHNIKIVCSQESEPLGTAGPIVYAKDVLRTNDPFFVINSDISSTFPLKELMAFHKQHKREASLVVTKVEEPSKYGVVVFEPDGKVVRFINKPKQYAGNYINAGIYILEPSVVERIPAGPSSMEKEIFPVMAQEGQLYCMPHAGYWLDIRTPKNHLLGMGKYVKHLRETNPAALSTHPAVVGDVIMDSSATIGKECVIGPDVVIGPDCVIEDGVHLERATLMQGCVIRKHSFVSDSIIGWRSTVGQWVRVENVTVLGEDVKLVDEIYVNGGLVLPHKVITSSVSEPKIIM
mmetsp:Transcript_5312/g.15748  ORF Transcript_5312/g.15748 Transcript_5312/m.15748 type:complete len:359 (+) Transcript_5312:48-1124(+)